MCIRDFFLLKLNHRQSSLIIIDIHDWIMDIHNCIHNWIMDIHDCRVSTS